MPLQLWRLPSSVGGRQVNLFLTYALMPGHARSSHDTACGRIVDLTYPIKHLASGSLRRSKSAVPSTIERCCRSIGQGLHEHAGLVD